MRRVAGWIVAGLVVAAPAAAELPKKVTKAKPLGGLPGHYDYRGPVDRSPTVSVQSSPAVVLQEVATAPDGVLEPRGPKLRYFQLPVRGLAVDHCSITRVVVSIRANGDYIVSFRADQNPILVGSLGDPALVDEAALRPLRIKETGHLKRNEFTVRFRLLGTPGRESLPPAGLGRPALANLSLTPFWVQRGEPRDVYVTGNMPAVKDYFGVIEGLEVDFSYR